MVIKFNPKIKVFYQRTPWVVNSYLEFELDDGLFYLLSEKASQLLEHGVIYVVEELSINSEDNRFGVKVGGVMFPQEFIKGY